MILRLEELLVWPQRNLGFGLGIVGLCLAAGQSVAQGPAQWPAHMRLTDPHTMTVATRTERAGEFELYSPPDGNSRVFVPYQCVRERRCPLLVVLPNHGILKTLRPAIYKHGVIVLVTKETEDHDTLQVYLDRGLPSPDLMRLDAELREVLRRFAIDPDKIAIMGRDHTGDAAAYWARYNSDLFSRVVMTSTDTSSVTGLTVTDPRNTTTETLVTVGVSEPNYWWGVALVQQLWKTGHPATFAYGFRGHQHQLEDYDFILQWLEDSWTTPRPGRAITFVDPLPELTDSILGQLARFWARFRQNNWLISSFSSRAYLREVVLPFGTAKLPSWAKPPSIPLMNMTALAAQYPSIARDLQAVGLTGLQHDAYRAAVLSARFVATTVPAGEQAKSLAGTTLEKNIKLVNTQSPAMQLLESTNFWGLQ